ncbi:MAG: NIL domain-containing protein [Clostridium sp.]
MIGKKTIPESSDEVTIRIVFVSKEKQQTILTRMARELDIDFSIIDGEMNIYKSGIMGTIHIMEIY